MIKINITPLVVIFSIAIFLECFLVDISEKIKKCNEKIEIDTCVKIYKLW